jgi:hypothetical protein
MGVFCGKILCFGLILIKILFAMKKTIIKYGLISGAIAAACILGITLVLKSYGFDKAGFDSSAYVGYSLIILSMAVIFFGIKAYRDNENDRKVTFGKGLLIGLSIALISSVCYSLMWLVVYYNFIPNFMDDYAVFCTKKLQESGASALELSKNQAQLQQIKDLYKTPFGIFAVTLIEPLPIGVLGALVSAFILKKK